jgi:ATP-dependent Clp protease, protease subunit
MTSDLTSAIDGASADPGHPFDQRELLRRRVVLMNGEMNDALSGRVVGQLILLEQEDPVSLITLYINSPGGSTPAGLAIYDTIQALNCPVASVCLGTAVGVSTLILASGTRGWRHATRNATVSLFQAPDRAQTNDPERELARIRRTKKRLIDLFAAHTRQESDRIGHDFERRTWMSAAEALEYGLIDRVGSVEALRADDQFRRCGLGFFYWSLAIGHW